MQKMKKTMSILLVLCLLLSLLPVAAFAEDAETDLILEEELSAGEITAETTAAYSGTCGENATWRIDDAGTMIIGGSGDMTDYTSDNGAPWKQVKDKIKSLVIRDGITTVGDYAFFGCSNLAEVYIPKGITKLGNNAFNACVALKAVSIPGTVKDIYVNAFYQCQNLSRVTLGNGVRWIMYHAFEDTAIKTMVIPQSVSMVDGKAFGYKNNIVDTSFTAWVHPQSSAYSFCSDNGIAYRLLEGACGDNVSWKLDDDGVMTISGSGNMTGFNRPTDVPWNAIRSYVKKLVIKDGVTNIGYYAFQDCVNLTQISIPSSVSFISLNAFSGCSALTAVAIPGTVGYIDKKAFFQCSRLSNVTLGEGVKYLGSSAFESTALKSLTVPASVTDIEAYAFGYLYDAGQHRKTANFTATVYEGSAAHSFCDKNGIAYTLIKNSFTDVQDPNAYYYQPVLWAVANGITQGTSSTTFSPDKECTRGQVVTFLWRAAGEPQPTGSRNPFSDVKISDYYYNAVLWAVEKGITVGTSSTTFSPDQPCTRAQVVTFQWRAAGKPTPTTTVNPFGDVASGAYYYDAVLWAVEAGITQGTSKTAFSPDKTCTRGQIVTFLYRQYNS